MATITHGEWERRNVLGVLRLAPFLTQREAGRFVPGSRGLLPRSPTPRSLRRKLRDAGWAWAHGCWAPGETTKP